MISYITEVTLCWAGFYLLYGLWLRKETFFRINRWYLLSTLILGLIIPMINVSTFYNPASGSLNAVVIEPITVTVQALENTLEEIVITPENKEAFDFQALFVMVYWLGVVLLGFRFLYGLFKIHRLKESGDIEEKETYFIVRTRKVHLPFSFFKTLFWSNEVNFESEEAEKILKHELTHIREWHSLDVVLLEVLCIFLWCSPLVFLYKNALRNIHEYLADAAVLQSTPTRHYGRLLLRQSMSGLRIAQANNFIHSQLKKRIKMMTKSKSRQRSLLKYFSIFPIAFFLLLVLANKNAEATYPSLTEESPVAAVATPESDRVLQGDPEEMPRFPGCEDVAGKAERQKCSNDKLIRFIFENIKYPETAKKAGIEGMVLVSFTVLEDGSLSALKAIKTLGGGCDEEALRVFKAMPKWIPGKENGKAVAVEMKLPIQFRLNGEDKIIEADNAEVEASGEEIFKVVEEMPRFPGCENLEDWEQRSLCAHKKLLQYIYENLSYPAEAKEEGIEGTVVIRFVVEKDGSISNREIKRSIGGGCDEEVLQVVGSMPNWIPGKQRGKVVKVEYNLPVKFRLDNGKAADKGAAVLKKLKATNTNYYLLVNGKEIHDISKLDPEDIESVDVLKGEIAVQKFGEKAKNGAILIRLKKANTSSANIPPPPSAPFLPEGFEQFNELELALFKVYPNPSDGMLNIDLGPVDRQTKVSVADASGRVVHFQVIKKTEGETIRLHDIDVRKAAKGNLYVIVEQGGKRITRKVALQ